MRKGLFLLACVTALLSVTHVNAQVRLGVKAGLNVAKTVAKFDGSTYKSDPLTAFHAGVVAELPLAGQLFLEPALLFSQKGSVVIEDGESYKITARHNYLEAPVNLLYKFPISEGTKIFVSGGPYVAYMVSVNGKEIDGSVSVPYFRSIQN